MESILSFKGFNKNLKCRDFQYKVGEEYEQKGEIKCCKKGFHACRFSTDVFGYYPPIDDNRYCIVTQSGDIDENNNTTDSKVASSKIFIKSEVSAEQLIEFGINYILNNIIYSTRTTGNCCCIGSGNTSITNNIYNCAAINTGSYSAAINNKMNSIAGCTNEHSIVINNGPLSVVGTTEDNSIITNTIEGDSSICGSTGNNSVIKNNSDKTILVSTGSFSTIINNGYNSPAISNGVCTCIKTTEDYSTAISTGSQSHVEAGNLSVAISTGTYSTARATGKESIAIATGNCSEAAGNLGDWIVLTEYNKLGLIKEVKAFKVDGEKVKPNTFYKLVDGEPVEIY
jgi:hypothetical protein